MKDTKKAKRTEIIIDVPFTDKEKAVMADAMVDIRDEMDDIQEKIKADRTEMAERQKDFDAEMQKLQKGTHQESLEVRVRKNFTPKDKGKPVIEYVDLKNDKKIIKTEVMLPGQYQVELDDWIIGDPMEAPERVETDSSSNDEGSKEEKKED